VSDPYLLYLANKNIFKSDIITALVDYFEESTVEVYSPLPKLNINIKTLGVHHGYNVDNDKIRKDIIDRMKNCIQA
jgi:hypothetical protein